MYVLWSKINKKYYGKVDGEFILVETISEAKKFAWYNPFRYLFKYYIGKYKNDDVCFTMVIGMKGNFSVSGRMGR